MAELSIRRGYVWVVRFDEKTIGREQPKTRPALVISSDRFNEINTGLAIVIPLTTTDRGFLTHIPLEPPEGGVKKPSFVMCEQVKSISTGRFIEEWGLVSLETMASVREVLSRLVDFV